MKKYSSETLEQIRASFRPAAFQLWHQWQKTPFKSLLVTSSIKKEGKTFFSDALAEYVTVFFDKILLVHYSEDASTEKETNAQAGKEQLARISSIISSADQTRGVTSLGLFAQKKWENTSWLFKNFDEIQESMNRQFDLIIFDFPPLNEDVFPFELLDRMEKIILVVRANYTRKKNIRQSLKRLDDYQEKLSGMVLNRRKEYIPKIFLSRR